MPTLLKQISKVNGDRLEEINRATDFVMEAARTNNLLCERLEGKNTVANAVRAAHYKYVTPNKHERESVIRDLRHLIGFKTYPQYWVPRLTIATTLLVATALGGARALNVNQQSLQKYLLPAGAVLLYLAKGRSSAGHFSFYAKKGNALDSKIEELGWPRINIPVTY